MENDHSYSCQFDISTNSKTTSLSFINSPMICNFIIYDINIRKTNFVNLATDYVAASKKPALSRTTE